MNNSTSTKFYNRESSFEIKTTVFIITVGDPAFPDCRKAVNNQIYKNFKLEIINNVRPFSAAAQEMINRCDTEYFIQVDEDMIMYPFAVKKMEEAMETAPDDAGMICFYLYDEDREENIQGIKIYRTKFLKDLKFHDVKASEMNILEQMGQRGVKWIAHPDVMGLHGTIYTPDTIYHRYKSMYEKDIRAWNILTWDIQKKARKLVETGDPVQLFAILGAAHGIINAPQAADKEKDFKKYQMKELDLFKHLLLQRPSGPIHYDPSITPKPSLNDPVPFEEVKWKPLLPAELKHSISSIAKSDKNLNILQTVEFYSPHIGGAELVVQQISERLAKRGHLVEVATVKLPERNFCELNGVSIHEFEVSGNLANGINGSDFLRYQNFLLNHPAHVMMNYAAQQWATDLAYDTIEKTKDRRVNIIAPCGYSALLDSKTVRWQNFDYYFSHIIPEVLPLYDAAVYHSALYKDYEYAENHGFKNGIIIPNGVDEEEFTSKPTMDFRAKYGVKKKYFGLCVANFYGGKGHDRVIECVRQMNRDDFNMVFIGKEGEELPKLKAQAEGLNILFCVNIPREDTIAAYQEADIFLFGSYIEASPLVIIEAKASGTPFVSTDCGNVREWKGGIVCSPEEMADNTNKVLDDEGLRKQLAFEGRQEWKDKLTWESVVDKYEDLYLKKHREKTGHNKSLHESVQTPKMSMTGVVFSKDRPLQLDATLRSFYLHCGDANDVSLKVLYTVSNESLEEAYVELKRDYPSVSFFREKSFKSDLLSLLQGADCVLFLVDDNIFVRDFHMSDAASSLQKYPEALGFSLRLGRNTTYCYSLDKVQRLPDFNFSEDYKYLRYNWTNAACDFGYPLEVSSSVYRIQDLMPFLSSLTFHNPNTLEGYMAENTTAFKDTRPYLLCFDYSATFCAPLNKVQSICANRASDNIFFSAENMSRLFAEGYRLDVAKYNNFIPNACHQEVELTLMPVWVKAPGLNHLISVIIPCYNQAGYLLEAVESVVSQTYTNWECIIVNDGSPDKTSEVAKELIAKYPDKKIVLLEKENGGLASARNFGVTNSKGKYILPLDSDDKLHPEILEKTAAVLYTYPDISIAYTGMREFGVKSNVCYPNEINPEVLRFQNLLCYCSLYRREVWEAVGGYNTNMVWGYEDWDFWIGCAEKGFRFRRIPEPLLLYRVKENSMYTKAFEHDAELKARIVLNHPGIYDYSDIEWAERVLSKTGLSLKKKTDSASTSPVVSVIVPTYNRPEMLTETLKSILDQTYQNIEIVVINDAGVDVEGVVNDLNRKNNIIYINHTENKGLAASRNTGLKAAKGKYIAYLDDDDIYYPDHIETLVRILEIGDHKVAYTDALRAYQEIQDGRYITVKKEIANTSDFDYDRILHENYIPVLCFMHEKSCIDEVGGFDETLGAHEDWDLWMRMSRKYKIAHIKKVTCEFSWRQDASTLTFRNIDIMDTTRQTVFQRGRALQKKRSGRVNIPSTTLCCIDCCNHELSIRALERSMRQCGFDRAVFFTDREFNLEDIEVVKIPTITTKQQYSWFVLKELNKHVHTDFVLMVQYDGFIINPEAWSPEFREYDYIGAKWHWYNDSYNVGNGGFSLRSKRLLQALDDTVNNNGISMGSESLTFGEDSFICRTYRGLLEDKYSIKFAPEVIADRFSYERSEPVGRPFGFHGLFNMWRYIKPEYLPDFVNTLSSHTLKSIEALELGVNYHKAGRLKEAETVYRKILEFHPDHQEALSKLKMISYPADQTKTKTGRNDPCPCGSGRKHKKCCGGKER